MDKTQIIKKIIIKAINKGWEASFRYVDLNSLRLRDGKIYLFDGKSDIFLETVRDIVFNHGFAKAYWGDELILTDNMLVPIPKWQANIQSMAIIEEPLEYFL